MEILFSMLFDPYNSLSFIVYISFIIRKVIIHSMNAACESVSQSTIDPHYFGTIGLLSVKFAILRQFLIKQWVSL